MGFVSELNSEPEGNPLRVSEGENDVLAQITSEDPVMELFRVSLKN